MNHNIENIKALINKLYWSDQTDELWELFNSLERKAKEGEGTSELYRLLAITELSCVGEDFGLSLEYFRNAHKLDPDNREVMIMIIYISQIWYRDMDKAVFSRLESMSTTDKKTLAICKYIESMSYYDDEPQHEAKLLESVELCNDYVTNNSRLGLYYIEKGDRQKGIRYIEKAIENMIISQPGEQYDVTDPNEYINEMITGVYGSEWRLKYLQDQLIPPKSFWEKLRNKFGLS